MEVGYRYRHCKTLRTDDSLECGEDDYRDILLNFRKYDKIPQEILIDDIDCRQSEVQNQQSSQRMLNISNEVLPLSPEDIRWFYVVKSNKLKPLVGYDSVRLENAWRLYHYNNISIDDVKPILIRGGIYEADIVQLKCYPVYWSSLDEQSERKEGQNIIRGSWFFEDNWFPLNQELASVLEQEHLKKWENSWKQDSEVMETSSVQHSAYFEDYHVDWLSMHEIIMYKDKKKHGGLRNFVEKFGIKNNGFHLHRGYLSPALFYESYLPITHLVLVVHGIGAKLNRNKIVCNTTMFQNTCNRVAPHSTTQRVEYIPVEWRSKVLLNEDLINYITPIQSQGIREFVNNSALDVLYYTSPLYRNDIMCGVRSEMNRVYKLFMEKNPQFKGKICVLAHSLGSVILHDILEAWEPVDDVEDSVDSYNVKVRSQLLFKVDTLFCIGSPLGLFLCLRGFQPPKNRQASQEDIIPTKACCEVFNFYHPADPIAYRLEPLLMPHYKDVPPVKIPSCASALKLMTRGKSKSYYAPSRGLGNDYIQLNPTFHSLQTGDASEENLINSPPVAKPSKLRSISSAVALGAVRILSLDTWRRRRPSLKGSFILEESDVTSSTSSDKQLINNESQQHSSIDLPRLKRRLDYQLAVGFTESKLGYAVFTSHRSYWNNQDLAMFIMNYFATDQNVIH